MQQEAATPFHVMAKPVGPACNLECSYCYYLETADLYPETSNYAMDRDTLASFVEQYIQQTPGDVVNFAWQGGEPTLLGVDFFRDAVELQAEYAPPGVTVTNSLQTNGTRLDAEWCEFLREEEFLVGISLDGPRELHDAHRETRDGEGTFDDVFEGLRLLQDHGVEHNVLCVVGAHNAPYPLDVYRFFREAGVEYLQFIPLVEPVEGGDPPDAVRPDLDDPTTVPEYGWPAAHRPEGEHTDAQRQAVAAAAADAPVSERSVGGREYGEFLCAVFDEWVRNDVGSVSVRIFDQCVRAWSGHEPDYCIFQATCGSALAVEHNGDVYACDHFVAPEHRRGNIHEESLSAMVDSPEQQAFGEAKQDRLPDYCRECAARAVCQGGCPRNRLLETPDGESGLNYLCAGYDLFFRHVSPYVTSIADAVREGGDPSRVMERVAALDERYGTAD